MQNFNDLYIHLNLYYTGNSNVPATGIFYDDCFSMKYYLRNGRYHRLDGPAIESLNDIFISKYYFNGKFIGCENNKKFFKIIKTLSIE